MQVIYRDGFGLNCMLNIFWIRAVSKPFLSIITLYPRSEVKSLDLGKLKALSKPGVWIVRFPVLYCTCSRSEIFTQTSDFYRKLYCMCPSKLRGLRIRALAIPILIGSLPLFSPAEWQIPNYGQLYSASHWTLEHGTLSAAEVLEPTSYSIH